MIIDISIENFLSIREKVVLSLEASSGSKSLFKNMIKGPNHDNLLKSIAVYGANASGKTNVVKAILFMYSMVINSHTHNVGNRINRIPFKLDATSEKKPSKFEINFIMNGVTYKYGFSFDNEKIINEYLYYTPKGRKALIFKRKNTTKFTFTIDKTKQEQIKNQTLENTLYLSRAAQLKYERVMEVYKFFKEDIIIQNKYSPQWANYTITQIYENPRIKRKILEILKAADFGGIEDIKIKKERRPVKQIMLEIGKEILSKKDSEDDFYDVKICHRKKTSDGREIIIDFDIDEESEGTKKTFVMLGPILDILERGKILIIDELESSLHPEIAKLLIKLFNTKNNKNSQLIFTTHNTNLLDNKLFRRDQIYFTSKKPNESTKMSSLLDFKLRQEADFERAYLNGRFNALPFIDETLFD